MNWLKQRVSKSIIITALSMCILNFVGGFGGYFFAYLGLYNESIVVFIGFSFTFLMLVLVAWSVLEDRSINRWNLVWYIIPSAVISAFAFLGFETLQAIDRANPSF